MCNRQVKFTTNRYCEPSIESRIQRAGKPQCGRVTFKGSVGEKVLNAEPLAFLNPELPVAPHFTTCMMAWTSAFSDFL